jgi:hypothetical protein
MMWVDKSDEVIWTFALMIYLERAVLACWRFMGFLYFEVPFFIRSFVFRFFSLVWTFVYVTTYLMRAVVVLGKISLGTCLMIGSGSNMLQSLFLAKPERFTLE